MRPDTGMGFDARREVPVEDTGVPDGAPSDAADAPPAVAPLLGDCTVRYDASRDLWDHPGAVETAGFALAAGSSVVVAARPCDGMCRTELAVVPFAAGPLAWSVVAGSEGDSSSLGPLTATSEGFLVGWSTLDGSRLVPLDTTLVPTGPGFVHPVGAQRLAPVGTSDLFVGANAAVHRFRGTGEWLGPSGVAAIAVAGGPAGGLAVHSTVRPFLGPASLRALDTDGMPTGVEHLLDLGRAGTTEVALAVGETSGVLVARVGSASAYVRVTRLELDGTPVRPDFLMTDGTRTLPFVVSHHGHFVLVAIHAGEIDAQFYDASLSFVGRVPIASYDPLGDPPTVWGAVSHGEALVVAFSRSTRFPPHPLSIARLACEP